MKYIQVLCSDDNYSRDNLLSLDMEMYQRLKGCDFYITSRRLYNIFDKENVRYFWVDNLKKEILYPIKIFYDKESMIKLKEMKFDTHEKLTTFLFEKSRSINRIDTEANFFTAIVTYVFGNRKIFLPEVENLIVPEKYKVKPNSEYLYYGIHISYEDFINLRKGGVVRLAPKKVSLWTTDLRQSIKDAKVDGYVLKLATEKAHVFLNFKAVQDNSFPLGNIYEDVLLDGNGGIISFSNKDINKDFVFESIEAMSWPSNDKDDYDCIAVAD